MTTTTRQAERGHLEAMAADELTEVPEFAALPSRARLECYARMGKLLAQARAEGRAEERETICDFLSLHHEGWVPSQLVPAISRGEHLKP